MQIKQSTHVWQSIFVTLTTLLMCVSLAVTSFAGYVGEGGGHTWGGSNATIGFTLDGSQLGYRIYLADSSTGEVKKDSNGYIIMDIMSNNFDYEFATGDAMTYYGGYRPRTDQDAAITYIDSDTMPSGMPLAIYYSGGSWHGNGSTLHDWMMQDCTVSGYSGGHNVDMIIKKYLGAEAFTMVQEGKADFIIEPVYVIPVFKTRTTTKPSSGRYESYTVEKEDKTKVTYYCPWAGITFYGTWFESLEILTKYDGSHSFMGPVSTATGNAMYLDEDILGLKSAAGKKVSSGNYKTPSTIGNWGFGIHIYKSSNTPTTPPPTSIKVYYHLYNSSDVQTALKTSTFDLGTSSTKQFTPSTAYGTPVAACIRNNAIPLFVSPHFPPTAVSRTLL